MRRFLLVVDGLRDDLDLDDQRGERCWRLECEVDEQVERLHALRELVLEADDLENVIFRERFVRRDNLLRSLDDHGSSEAVAQLFRAGPGLVLAAIFIYLGAHARLLFNGDVRGTLELDALRARGKELLQRFFEGGKRGVRQVVERADADARVELGLERGAAHLILEGDELGAPQRRLVRPVVEGLERDDVGAPGLVEDLGCCLRDARLGLLVQVVRDERQVHEPLEAPRLPRGCEGADNLDLRRRPPKLRQARREIFLARWRDVVGIRRLPQQRACRGHSGRRARQAERRRRRRRLGGRMQVGERGRYLVRLVPRQGRQVEHGILFPRMP